MDNWHDSRLGQIQQFKAQQAQRKLAKLAEEEARRQKLQREVEARQRQPAESQPQQKQQAESRQPRATNKAGYCVACDGLVSFEAQNCPHCGQPDAGKRALEAKEKWTVEAEESAKVIEAAIRKDADKAIVEKAIRKRINKCAPFSKADLDKVKGLLLHNTKITDAGLMEVAKLQQLIYLGLRDTKVTKEGVAELKKALPKCEIDW